MNHIREDEINFKEMLTEVLYHMLFLRCLCKKPYFNQRQLQHALIIQFVSQQNYQLKSPPEIQRKFCTFVTLVRQRGVLQPPKIFFLMYETKVRKLLHVIITNHIASPFSQKNDSKLEGGCRMDSGSPRSFGVGGWRNSNFNWLFWKYDTWYKL